MHLDLVLFLLSTASYSEAVKARIIPSKKFGLKSIFGSSASRQSIRLSSGPSAPRSSGPPPTRGESSFFSSGPPPTRGESSFFSSGQPTLGGQSSSDPPPTRGQSSFFSSGPPPTRGESSSSVPPLPPRGQSAPTLSDSKPPLNIDLYRADSAPVMNKPNLRNPEMNIQNSPSSFSTQILEQQMSRFRNLHPTQSDASIFQKAAAQSQIEVIRSLFLKPAFLKTVSTSDDSTLDKALGIAIKNQDVKLMKLLLLKTQNDATLKDAINPDLINPAYFLIALSEKKVNKNQLDSMLNLPNDFAPVIESAMKIAIKTGRLDVAQALLTHPTAFSKNFNPFTFAVAEKNANAIIYMLQSDKFMEKISIKDLELVQSLYNMGGFKDQKAILSSLVNEKKKEIQFKISV